MYEALISPAVAATGAPGSLRAIDWSELVARFAAARDLRAAFAVPVSMPASFADRARGGFACAAESEGQRDVNLDALGGGKMPSSISFATAREAAEGDQGTR